MDHPLTHAKDFFKEDGIESTKLIGRSLGNRLLTGLCIALSFAALVPLASILYLVMKNGLPLLDWSIFTQLPPAAGMTGGGFGGSTVTLCESRKASEIAAALGAEYEKATGIKPQIFASRPSQGAHLVG